MYSNHKADIDKILLIKTAIKLNQWPRVVQAIPDLEEHKKRDDVLHELALLARDVTLVERVGKKILIYTSKESVPQYLIETDNLWINKKMDTLDKYYPFSLIRLEAHVRKFRQIVSVDTLRVFLQDYLRHQLSMTQKEYSLLPADEAYSGVPKESEARTKTIKFRKLKKIMWPIGMFFASYFCSAKWLHKKLNIPEGQSIFIYPH
jgi:hypothetical protein